MATCPQCGTAYAAHVRLCPRDGTVLEDDPAVDARIGQVVEGKYRIEQRIGGGGMGIVYRATHLMLAKPLAIKFITPALVSSAEVVRRFQREARATSLLSHPNIAASYDLGQTDDGTLYIAMELVEGLSLKKLIQTTGAIEPSRIIVIARQVAAALGAAHEQQIVHRDLKPQNVMLARGRQGREIVKLLDFGIAKTFDESATQLTATGMAVGTPQYMSPEQAKAIDVDARSDLYSFGVILYEMLVGDVPFQGASTPAILIKHVTDLPQPPSLRRPDLSIPPLLEAIALRCLEKDPAGRYQNADALLEAIEEAAITMQGGRPIPVTTAEPAVPRVQTTVPDLATPIEPPVGMGPRASDLSTAVVATPPPVLPASEPPAPVAATSPASLMMTPAAEVTPPPSALSTPPEDRVDISASDSVSSMVPDGAPRSRLFSISAIGAALFAPGCLALQLLGIEERYEWYGSVITWDHTQASFHIVLPYVIPYFVVTAFWAMRSFRSRGLAAASRIVGAVTVIPLIMVILDDRSTTHRFLEAGVLLLGVALIARARRNRADGTGAFVALQAPFVGWAVVVLLAFYPGAYLAGALCFVILASLAVFAAVRQPDLLAASPTSEAERLRWTPAVLSFVAAVLGMLAPLQGLRSFSYSFFEELFAVTGIAFLTGVITITALALVPRFAGSRLRGLAYAVALYYGTGVLVAANDYVTALNGWTSSSAELTLIFAALVAGMVVVAWRRTGIAGAVAALHMSWIAGVLVELLRSSAVGAAYGIGPEPGDTLIALSMAASAGVLILWFPRRAAASPTADQGAPEAPPISPDQM